MLTTAHIGTSTLTYTHRTTFRHTHTPEQTHTHAHLYTKREEKGDRARGTVRPHTADRDKLNNETGGNGDIRRDDGERTGHRLKTPGHEKAQRNGDGDPPTERNRQPRKRGGGHGHTAGRGDSGPA